MIKSTKSIVLCQSTEKLIRSVSPYQFNVQVTQSNSIARCCQQLSKRLISQHLTIRPQPGSTAKQLNFNVNLLKVPTNYGYYSSRVNRLYNEDRYTVGILDVDLKDKKILSKKEEKAQKLKANKFLESRIDSIDEPEYTNTFKYQRVFSFSVFDGHGGEECSTYIKSHLMENVQLFQLTETSITKLFKFYQRQIGGYWKRWARRQTWQFIETLKLTQQVDINEVLNNDKKLWELDAFKSIRSEEFFKLRVYLSFLFTDYQFLNYEDHYNNKLKDPKNEKLMNSGSTCTSAFIYSIEQEPTNPNGYFYQEKVLSRLLIAHIGDTRAILCDKEGLAHSLTKDHHPSNPSESTRLTRFSSGLLMTDSFGEERFLNFANTRSFGDLTAKNIGVSSEPQLSEYLIGDPKMMSRYKYQNMRYLKDQDIGDFGGDECFLVLVSDGVTGYLSDQEIVDLITSTTNNKGAWKGTPHEASKEVVQFVESIGGDDNATCCVIKLSGWGKWPLIDRTGSLREEKMMSAPRGNRGR